MFLGSGMGPGVYLTLINETGQDLNHLGYQFGEYSLHKIGRIKKDDKKQILLMNNFTYEDTDLVIEDEGQKYVLKGLVKKFSRKEPYVVYFYRVRKENGQLVLIEDKEKQNAFWKKS